MAELKYSLRFETACIHAGQPADSDTGALMTPIFQTSTYLQDEVGKPSGYDYARTGNPTRTALENAASVASLLLTTEATIVEKPEEKKSAPPMPGGGGGMGDMY